ncbi:MAG: hypothetical protein AB1585_17770 [Thermodesulfobacteriota bacterium]
MDSPVRKFSVGGLKLSAELVLLRLKASEAVQIVHMFRVLTEHQINLIGVTLDAFHGRLDGVCSLLAEDRVKAEKVLGIFQGCLEMTAPVGTITVFPVQARIELLSALFAAWGGAGLPLYHIASSTSSLTITTDFQLLDDAVSVVSRVVSLPENHAPFRPEFRVKQI